MDPFSHFLLGYLLGFGVWGPSNLQYVVAAAVAGGLPDADIALYPLSGRFPLLRHRGISHSIFGVTVIAAVGTFLVPLAFARVFGAGFAAGSPWAYFIALELGGLSHVLLDAMDHWSVPILAPFRETEYSFDADRIANFGGMAFTVVAYTAMLYERGRTPLWTWVVTAWLLLAAVGLFFAIRLSTRWAIEEPRRAGGYTSVIPQVNPFCFLLYVEEPAGTDLVRFRYVRYHLIGGRTTAGGSVEGRSNTEHPAPIISAREAAAASYASALKVSWFLEETNRFARVRGVPGGFEVFWYSLEMSFWGRSAGVLAHVDAATGAVSARSAWRNPERFAA